MNVLREVPSTTGRPIAAADELIITPGTQGALFLALGAAVNAGGTSAESAKVPATTDQATDSITISSAKWKARDFKIVGTGNTLGAIVTAYKVNADGSLTAIPGATAPVVAAAPPGIGDWTIRLRDAAAGTSNPGRILVKSDKGGQAGQAGPFTVSYG